MQVMIFDIGGAMYGLGNLAGLVKDGAVPGAIATYLSAAAGACGEWAAPARASQGASRWFVVAQALRCGLRALQARRWAPSPAPPLSSLPPRARCAVGRVCTGQEGSREDARDLSPACAPTP